MNFNLTLIMQAVAFGPSSGSARSFVWPPLMRAIETRQKQIADGLAAGEQGRQRARQRREARRGDARGGQGALGGNRRHRREVQGRAIEQAKIDAKAEADRIVAAAKAEIEQEVARAKEQLRDSVADLAVAGAAQILKRDVDRKVHAQLLAQLEARSCCRER